MKSRRLRLSFCILMLAVFLLPWTSVGESKTGTRTFDNPRHGFSITLPENWETLPDDKMAELNSLAARTYPDWQRPAVHYGYQQKGSQDFVFKPFLFIRVMELGHEPKPEFVRVEISKDRDRSSGVEIGEPVSDAELDAFVAPCEMNLEGRAAARALLAVFATRESLIKVFCFAAPSDVESHPELLRQMISGIRIHESFRTDRSKRSPTGLIVVIVAIVVVIAVLAKAKTAESQTS